MGKRRPFLILFPSQAFTSCLCVFRDQALKHRIIRQTPVRTRFGEHPAMGIMCPDMEGFPEEGPFGLDLKDEECCPQNMVGDW